MSSLHEGLLDILVCPISRGKLIYDEQKSLLISVNAKKAFPVIDGTPILLISESMPLEDSDIDTITKRLAQNTQHS